MSPPSLHILMTTDAVGGVWVYATALARGLCETGCRVTLVSLGPAPRADQLRDASGVAGLDVLVTDLALEWMDPEGCDLARAGMRLAEIERSIGPDIIHLNGYRDATGEWSAPVVVAAHSCVGSWWRACRGELPSEPRWAAYLDNVRAGLAAADQWVAPTAPLRDAIDEIYAPPTPGRVIWNGLDSSFTPAAKQPFILAAGRLWDEAKNVASLARVADRVPWPIRVAGPLASPAKAAEQTDHADGLQPLGELSHGELMQHMCKAGIFAAPALYEPFGLTVLEAANAGCALVLADIPSLRELWSGAALFANPHDASAWASALSAVAENAALRQHLQHRARRRARRYSLGAMTGAYLELYRDAMRQHRSATTMHGLTGEARP